MRCSCHACGTYMVHSESMELGCVCPECGYRCKACLGTDSVVSREGLKNLAGNAALMNEILSSFDETGAEAADFAADDPRQYED